MQFRAVASSTVAAVGYDPAAATLAIQFHSGTEYHYFGVPEHHYSALVSASSVGGYLDRHIKKGGYRYSQIR